jgi:hypothetical protein
MKSIVFFVAFALSIYLQLSPLPADDQPTAFEKALYEKTRYQVLCGLNDQEFVSYCVTMNVGGETLLKFHDQILQKQTELADLVDLGVTAEDPKVVAVNAALKDLRAQYAVKIIEARKGLEIESRIAEETLRVLPASHR